MSRRIVTANGKKYVVGRTSTDIYQDTSGKRATTTILEYWTERDGEASGTRRTAAPGDRPGSVSRAVWDAAQAG